MTKDAPPKTERCRHACPTCGTVYTHGTKDCVAKHERICGGCWDRWRLGALHSDWRAKSS